MTDFTLNQCFSIAMGVVNCIGRCTELPSCILSSLVMCKLLIRGVAVDHGYGKMSTMLSPHDLKMALTVCNRRFTDSLCPRAS